MHSPIRNNKFKNLKKDKSNSMVKKSEENEKQNLLNFILIFNIIHHKV